MLEELERLVAGKLPPLELGGLVVLKFRDDGGTDGFFDHHAALGVFQFLGFAHAAEGHHHAAVEGPVFINGAGMVFFKKWARLVDDQLVPIHLFQALMRFENAAHPVDGFPRALDYAVQVDAVLLDPRENAVPLQLGNGDGLVTAMPASALAGAGGNGFLERAVEKFPERLQRGDVLGPGQILRFFNPAFIGVLDLPVGVFGFQVLNEFVAPRHSLNEHAETVGI